MVAESNSLPMEKQEVDPTFLRAKAMLLVFAARRATMSRPESADAGRAAVSTMPVIASGA